jgi:hypothetical protein
MNSNFDVKFQAHGKFYIRKGWLSKGLKNVRNDPTVFVRKDKNPMDTLGLGSAMVTSMRYWLQAVGLTTEPVTGKRPQTFTPLGEIIYRNDPYIEEIGSLWLLHYQLASNRSDATTWYFFFNEFTKNEFSKEDFIIHIKNYLRINDKDVSESSIDNDFDCLVHTYISRIKANPGKIDPENNIDCPFGELGLIDIADKRAKLYKKSVPAQDDIPPLILLSIILDRANGEKSIRISSIQNDACNVGKVFNLDIIALTSLLYRIERDGYIKVVRTAGLDIIEIKTNLSFLECVEEYYKQINN